MSKSDKDLQLEKLRADLEKLQAEEAEFREELFKYGLIELIPLSLVILAGILFG